MQTPSYRFPLQAGGTETVLRVVPLAKRGEPYGGGKQVQTPSFRFPLQAGGTEQGRSGAVINRCAVSGY